MIEQTFFFAVEPDELTVIAKWPIAKGASVQEAEELRAACEAMVGPDIVILWSDDHPTWHDQIAAVGFGIDPFVSRKGVFRRLLSKLKEHFGGLR